MTLQEAIEARRSVRNFDGKGLTEAETKALNDIITKALAEDPFKGRIAIKLASVGDGGTFKPSTYGVITGARDYLLMNIAPDSLTSRLGAGYAMEEVVLKARQMGLGTCWIAATFKGSAFAEAAGADESMPLKIVVPVGKPAAKGSLLNSLTRAIAGSSKRKGMEQLFYEENDKTPITAGSEWWESLEMLRLAPSSTNSQPWRAICHKDHVDFFVTSGQEIADLNLGIALYHFKEGGRLSGGFTTLPTDDTPRGWRYVISFVKK